MKANLLKNKESEFALAEARIKRAVKAEKGSR